MALDYIELPDLTTTVYYKPEKDFSWLDGLSGLAGTVYNLFTNKRDFDYQKALQQQIFQREDTAVQRRMSDLKAAGLNPNLAAGSAAAAGAVVGRSSTNDINPGAFLDNAAAVSQIKAQNIQNKILEQEKRTAVYNAEMARMSFYEKAYETDFNNDWYRFLRMNDKDKEIFKMYYPSLYQYYNNLLRDQQNSSSILQKQNDWFTANQIINAVGDVASGISLFTPKSIRKLYK